ncbi:hemolysin-III protein [Hypoxylon cercidicola]|nr:hemolysin-III protein [Hypoxylon cercidicola]
MSGPEVKKRYVQGVSTSKVEASMTRPTAEARTVIWHETSEWQRDNKYILSGYRSEKADYLGIFASLTFLHNETCNVYTHLVGALLLPVMATAFMRVLSEPHFLNVSDTDYVMFGIFFWCAECCLILSATYHLVGPHSHDVEQFWHRMDLLGIVIVTVGTFIPGIYYIFTCEPGLQKLHWTIIIASGSATATLLSSPRFGTPRWRNAKVGAFVTLGASAFIPLLHGVQLYGLKYMLQYSGMKWYLLELVFYGSGVSLYAFRTPERFAPGKFDIWGSSHQIFHVSILCAMYIHAIALTQAFTACHTLDLCIIHAAHRAGQI